MRSHQREAFPAGRDNVPQRAAGGLQAELADVALTPVDDNTVVPALTLMTKYEFKPEGSA